MQSNEKERHLFATDVYNTVGIGKSICIETQKINTVVKTDVNDATNC